MAVVVALAIGGGLALSNGGRVAYDPGPHTITGSLELTDNSTYPSIGVDGESCWGTGGYDDLVVGAKVVITDPDDAVIGTGQVDRGTVISPNKCSFEFSVFDVPDASSYSIEISHRGKVAFDRDDLQSYGWHAELVIGDD